MTMNPYRVIPLTRNFVAIISASDYRRTNKHQWYAHVSRGKKVYLHRFIMDAPQFMHVDHTNHQTLDCRRENLEVVRHTVNQSRRRNVKKVRT